MPTNHYAPFDELLAETRRAGHLWWNQVELDFLQVISEFDSEYMQGNRKSGWYQTKARYFNDLVALLISNATGFEVATRTKRRSILFDEIDIDLCYPKTGEPVVAGEVKALGTPPHPRNKGKAREAKSDLHKRVREVAFTSMDIKAAHTGPCAIHSFNHWISTATPAYLSFWALRVGSEADKSKCRSILAGLAKYCNGVGAFLYQPTSDVADYRALKFPEISMDTAIHEFVQRVGSANSRPYS